MIGPVSSTGRAMMASLEQAIQKGMPPDQAIQYVKSMATQGVAPLADLYSMMNQFQRLKQQQVQPPQTPPTIRDQLNVMDQQQRMQQMQQAAMARGLGGMNAGRMENPSFAGGGIVAFSNGDLVEDEVKRILEKDPYQRTAQENEILRRAGIELSRRELGEDSLVSRANRFLAGIPQAVRTTVSPFGALSEEELAQQGGTGAINERIIRALGGEQLKPAAPQTPAVARPQSAVPSAGGRPYSGSFDQMLAGTRADSFGRPVAQDARTVSAPPESRGRAGAGTGTGGTNTFARLIQEERNRKFEKIPETFSGEEKARIEKALSGLSSEKKDAVRMALAQAGFGMAAAASRAGRQRTTGLGALAEGAIGGLQQYNAAQKELRQTERELNKEMSALRRYQDEVARGDRARELDFEEKRRDNIASLTAQQESSRIQLAQLASAAEDRRLTREQRQIERREDLSLSEKTLQIRALEGQRDRAAGLLKTTFDPAAQAALQQEVKYYNDQIAKLSGVAAFGGVSGAGSFPGFSATLMK